MRNTFQVPEGHTAEEILHAMRYSIFAAASFGYLLENPISGIGHMGENAYTEKVQEVLDALQEVLKRYFFSIIMPEVVPNHDFRCYLYIIPTKYG